MFNTVATEVQGIRFVDPPFLPYQFCSTDDNILVCPPLSLVGSILYLTWWLEVQTV